MSEAENWKEKGNNFLKQKRYDDAISCYLKAIEIDPSNAVYHSNLSAAFVNIEHFHDGLIHAQKAVNIDPLYDKAHIRKIHCLLALQRGSSARKAIKECQSVLTNANKYTTEIEKQLEAKTLDLKKALLVEHNHFREKKWIVEDGKLSSTEGSTLSEYLANSALLKKHYPPADSDSINPLTNLSAEQIEKLVQEVEKEKCFENKPWFVGAKKILKQFTTNSFDDQNMRQITTGIDNKYIKKDTVWYLFFYPSHQIVVGEYPRPTGEEFRPFLPVMLEMSQNGMVHPLAMAPSEDMFYEHPKYGHALNIVRSICLAIDESKSNSKGKAFLPETLVITGKEFVKSVAETIVNHVMLKHLVGFKNVMQCTRDSLPGGMENIISSANSMMCSYEQHPIAIQQGMRDFAEKRGEGFTVEFGKSLFKTIEEFYLLSPWKFISPEFPLHITVRHTKYANNKKLNEITLKNLLDEAEIVEGLDMMDGKLERIICIMGATDHNARGFSYLKNISEFKHFIRNPNFVDEAPSVQFGLLSTTPHNDLDDVETYNWPVAKDKDGYPFIVNLLKGFFVTMAPQYVKRLDLANLKWIEAATLGMIEYMKKCVKHGSLFGMEGPKNFLVTEESSKTGFRVQTYDGEAYVTVMAEKDATVRSTTFIGNTRDEVEKQMEIIQDKWAKEMDAHEKGTLKKCHVCGITKSDLGKKLFKCGRCKKVLYCSKECQTHDWPSHKTHCTTE